MVKFGETSEIETNRAAGDVLAVLPRALSSPLVNFDAVVCHAISIKKASLTRVSIPWARTPAAHPSLEWPAGSYALP